MAYTEYNTEETTNQPNDPLNTQTDEPTTGENAVRTRKLTPEQIQKIEAKRGYTMKYDELLNQIPMDVMYMHLNHLVGDSLCYQSQGHISARSTAETFRDMGMYEEGVHIDQLTNLILKEAELLHDRRCIYMDNLLSIQAMSLNAVYTFTVNKFVNQKEEEGKNPDTRMLHYALTAQNQFINTAKTIIDYNKPVSSADPFAPPHSR